MKRNEIMNFFASIAYITLFGLLSSCAKQTKTKEEMNFDELKEKTFVCIEKQDREMAIEYLEQIVALHAERADIAKYKMLLAETYFKNENHAAAHEMYEHFNQFYPSDKLAEYSKYKSILAKFYQTLRTDCDQTPTEETVKLCKNYLNVPEYKQYSRDVEDIKRTCTQKLVDKEIYIFDFYMHKQQYDAARKRLDFLRATHLRENPELEPRILYLECKLAKQQKQQDVLNQNIMTLASKYPDTQYASMGQALVAKNTFIF